MGLAELFQDPLLAMLSLDCTGRNYFGANQGHQSRRSLAGIHLRDYSALVPVGPTVAGSVTLSAWDFGVEVWVPGTSGVEAGLRKTG